MSKELHKADSSIERITLHAYRAVEYPEASGLFAEEHNKLLTEIGISPVTKASNRWREDPNVYVIAAEHDELGLVGGIRVHVSHSPEQPLPIEFSVGKLDPALPAFVDKMSGGGVAEINGLWNAHRFANRGLPMLLGMAAVSITSQLKVDSVIAVLARSTLRYAIRLGLQVVEEVGEKGWFVYPKPGFWGIVMCAADLFAFRLFGNMFAGIVLVAIVGGLLGKISILPAMIMMFELFVGVIQAFVFGMLTMVFMAMATQGHGDEEHAEH